MNTHFSVDMTEKHDNISALSITIDSNGGLLNYVTEVEKSESGTF